MKIIVALLSFVIAVVIISLILAWPFMWLWNGAVVEALTVAKPIGYWVSFCLIIFVSAFLAKSNSSK